MLDLTSLPVSGILLSLCRSGRGEESSLRLFLLLLLQFFADKNPAVYPYITRNDALISGIISSIDIIVGILVLLFIMRTDKEELFSLRYASLILAGHYNGGQWRIPFAGAIYVPELGWFPKDDQVQGLSYVAGVPQFISPGLGSDPHYEHQPGRIFNSPVITRIVLTSKATK